MGYEYGGINPSKPPQNRHLLILNPEENINEIIIYEDHRKIINPYRYGKLTHIIVGIYFKTDRGQERMFGSNKGIQKQESFKDYFLGYVQGKSGDFVDSLHFTWYKICLNNSTIFE